jgi:peptidoglycan/LPS O-acetylase OafA/YrhL
MRIEKLDGLRGIFSMMLVFYHYPQEYLPAFIFNNFLLRESYTFVDFFFVLSGFVISYNYSTISNSADFFIYLKKRFIRLFPLLIYTSLVYFAYIIFSGSILINFFPEYFNGSPIILNFQDHIEPLLDVLFFTNSTPLLGTINSINSPSWSISSEMISYIFFGLLTLFFSKKNKEKFFLILILFSAVVLFYNGTLFLSQDYGFLRGLISFILGYFVWKFHKKNFLNNTSELIIPILLLIILFILNYLENNSDKGVIYRLYVFIIPLFYSFSILILLKSNGFISKFLESMPIRYIGKLSYSIYLNHFIIQFILFKLIYRVFEIEQSLINQLIIVVFITFFTVFYSHYTHKYIELKVGKFLKNKIIT